MSKLLPEADKRAYYADLVANESDTIGHPRFVHHLNIGLHGGFAYPDTLNLGAY